MKTWFLEWFAASIEFKTLKEKGRLKKELDYPLFKSYTFRIALSHTEENVCGSQKTFSSSSLSFLRNIGKQLLHHL